MEAGASSRPGAVSLAAVGAAGGQSGQTSNTQAWMERYARRIKPNERKTRTKSFRRVVADDLPTNSKFGDEVVSKVLLLARWRSKARKQADDKGFTMAARRPWLSRLKEVSERSGCVYGAGMEHDGIDPHVEMVLRVAHAEEDKRLDLAAEQQAKELTPMDVIQQRVRQAMRGVQLWTVNGGRTVGSDDEDRSYRGGRRRSVVVGGSKDGSVRNGGGLRSRRRSSDVHGGAAVAAQRASLLMPVAAAALGIPLGSEPRALSNGQPPSGDGALSEVTVAARLAGESGMAVAAAAAGTPGPSSGLAASTTAPATAPPQHRGSGAGDDGGGDAGLLAANEAAAGGGGGNADVAAADPTSSSGGGGAAPQPRPSAPGQRGSIWPDRGAVAAVLPGVLESGVFVGGPMAAAGLTLRASGAGGGEDAAAGSGALVISGGAPGPSWPTRGYAALEGGAVFPLPGDLGPSPSPPPLAGHHAAPRLGGVAGAQHWEGSYPQQLQYDPRSPGPPPRDLDLDTEMGSGENPDMRPLSERAYQSVTSPMMSRLLNTAASGGLLTPGGDGASLHDIAPSLGAVDVCRVAPGSTAAAAAADTASLTLMRQVRGGPLPHSLTMTKRGRRPAPAPAPAPILSPASTLAAGTPMADRAAPQGTAVAAAAAPPPPGGKAGARRAGRGRPLDGVVGAGGSGAAAAAAGALGARTNLGESMGRHAHFGGASGGVSSCTSVSGESPAVSCTMVDAAVFWGSEASSPHGFGFGGFGGGGGGGGSGGSSPHPRPLGGGGAISRLASMVSIRGAPQMASSMPGQLGESLAEDSPGRRRKADGAAAAVRRKAASETSVLDGASGTSGDFVDAAGAADCDCDGDAADLPLSSVSLVNPEVRLAALSSHSVGGGGGDATAAAAPTSRSPSIRSLTSWPGTAPSSAPQPFVSNHPIQLPALEVPRSPARAADLAAAAGAVAAAAVPPLQPFPSNRLQPLHPLSHQPQPVAGNSPASPVSPVLRSPSTARSSLVAVSVVSVTGPMGQSSPPSALTVASTRISGLASPARLLTSVTDCPHSREVLQHQGSSSLSSMGVPSSPGAAVSAGGAPISPSERQLPPIASEPAASRTARFELEDSPPLQPQPPPGSRPPPPPPPPLAARSVVSLSSISPLGTASGGLNVQPPNHQIHPNHHHQPSYHRRASGLAVRRPGGSMTDLAGIATSGGAAAAATLPAPVSPDAASQEAAGSGGGGLSRLASDSSAVLPGDLPSGPAPQGRLTHAVLPGRRQGTMSGPQPRMFLPDLRNSMVTVVQAQQLAAAAAAAATETSTTTAAAAPAASPPPPPPATAAAGRLLPEIPSLAVGPAVQSVQRNPVPPPPLPPPQPPPPQQQQFRGRAL